MLGYTDFGSLKIDGPIYLPNCEMKRIILYPRLVKVSWDKVPGSIKDCKKKLETYKQLLQKLSDRDLGGFRVEGRCTGTGDPKEWVNDFVAFFNSKRQLSTHLSRIDISIPSFLQKVTAKIDALEAISVGRNEALLMPAQLKAHQEVVQAFGYNLRATGAECVSTKICKLCQPLKNDIPKPKPKTKHFRPSTLHPKLPTRNVGRSRRARLCLLPGTRPAGAISQL